jgi:FkbM family methyltransferase
MNEGLHAEEPATRRVHSIYGEIECYKKDLITDQIEAYGAHTRPEFAFAFAALDPGANVFDLGAHIGTFSLGALKKLRPGTQLLCVEGNTVTFSILARNLDGRGPAEITPLCGFVGASSGMSYQERPGNTGAGRLVRDKGGAEIATLHIDTLAKDYFPPDYIKIDVEGLEFAALSESRILCERRPILYMEVGREALRNHGHTPGDLDRLLKRLGYRFFVNDFDRNAAHDLFSVKQISGLVRWRGLFDALCVPEGSEVERALSRLSRPSSIRLASHLSRDIRRKISRMLP